MIFGHGQRTEGVAAGLEVGELVEGGAAGDSSTVARLHPAAWA